MLPARERETDGRMGMSEAYSTYTYGINPREQQSAKEKDGDAIQPACTRTGLIHVRESVPAD